MLMASASPPPTVNNLDPLQRTRLLRSTRKLEALLGTTPYLSEDAHSPRTSRAYRREGRVFTNPSPSPSSSSSRTSSPTADSGFVLVSHSLLDTPLPPFQVSLDVNTEERSSRKADKLPSTSGSKSKTRMEKSRKKGNQPTPLPHPLVLCLRSVPVSAPHSFPSTHSPPSNSNTSTHPRIQIQIPTASLAPHLSPTPPSPAPSADEKEKEQEQENEKDQRRRKMAKLARTLGEPVPTELVFPSSPSAAFAEIPLGPEDAPLVHAPAPLPAAGTSVRLGRKFSRLGLGRSRSAAGLAGKDSAQAQAQGLAPVLEVDITRHSSPPTPTSSSPHARTQPPPSLATLFTPPSLSALFIPPPSTTHTRAQYKHRHTHSSPVDGSPAPFPPPSTAPAPAPTPASASIKAPLHRLLSRKPTLPTSSTLQVPEAPRRSRSRSRTRRHSERRRSRSLGAADDGELRECGNWRETEWSGEWNRDMQDVMRGLRGLKGR